LIPCLKSAVKGKIRPCGRPSHVTRRHAP